VPSGSQLVHFRCVGGVVTDNDVAVVYLIIRGIPICLSEVRLKATYISLKFILGPF
jgi:hypothetical protein